MKPNSVIDFILVSAVPHGRILIYATVVLDHRPLKTETWYVRITVGGDRLSYPYDSGWPLANTLETNLSITLVAKNGARFMLTDQKDYFLNTTIEHPESMKVP